MNLSIFLVIFISFTKGIRARYPCHQDLRGSEYCEDKIYRAAREGAQLCRDDTDFKYSLCCKSCEAVYGGEIRAAYNYEFALPKDGYCADDANAYEFCDRLREGKAGCLTLVAFRSCTQTCGYCADFEVKAESLNAIGTGLPDGLRRRYHLQPGNKPKPIPSSSGNKPATNTNVRPAPTNNNNAKPNTGPRPRPTAEKSGQNTAEPESNNSNKIPAQKPAEQNNQEGKGNNATETDSPGKTNPADTQPGTQTNVPTPKESAGPDKLQLRPARPRPNTPQIYIPRLPPRIWIKNNRQ